MDGISKDQVAQMNIYDRLRKIQLELKVPKKQFNSFSNFYYRNCEDIVEAVKPLCDKYDVTLLIRDELEQIGERYYIKATASILHLDEELQATGYAREEESKKGMDAAQVTGSASSYARKYALNGLFAIDDTDDADSHDNSANVTARAVAKPAVGSTPEPATPVQKRQITAMLRSLGVPDEDMVPYVKRERGLDLHNITKPQAVTLLKELV